MILSTAASDPELPSSPSTDSMVVTDAGCGCGDGGGDDDDDAEEP